MVQIKHNNLDALMFVNRVHELAFLARVFARPEAQLIVLWGRRRVGKTALLQAFSQCPAGAVRPGLAMPGYPAIFGAR
jgi:hypothetical protein